MTSVTVQCPLPLKREKGALVMPLLITFISCKLVVKGIHEEQAPGYQGNVNIMGKIRMKKESAF